MNIYIMDGMAFIRISDTTMLCIGSKEEVDRADDKKIIEMVGYAVFVSQTFEKKAQEEVSLSEMPMPSQAVN